MGNRNEITWAVNGISFMSWEDDLYQYVTAADGDEMKLFQAGKALRRIGKWPTVKIGPAKDMPKFYSLFGQRTLVEMKAAQAERDKDIIDAFVVIDFNKAEERFRCCKCDLIFDSSEAGKGHVIWSRTDEAYFIRCPGCEEIGISEAQDVPERSMLPPDNESSNDDDDDDGEVLAGSPGL
jgi:hypothetical protein